MLLCADRLISTHLAELSVSSSKSESPLPCFSRELPTHGSCHLAEVCPERKKISEEVQLQKPSVSVLEELPDQEVTLASDQEQNKKPRRCLHGFLRWYQ